MKLSLFAQRLAGTGQTSGQCNFSSSSVNIWKAEGFSPGVHQFHKSKSKEAKHLTHPAGMKEAFLSAVRCGTDHVHKWKFATSAKITGKAGTVL